MDIIINYSRPGKGIKRYVEGLVEENRLRIKTLKLVAADVSRQWCEEFWWCKGYIPRSVLIGSEMKFLFYREWFCAMQLLGIDGEPLGCYVDIATPVRKHRGEYFITDLYLDFWITPDGRFYELDQDEFEQGYRNGMLSPYQYRKAGQVFKKIRQSIIASGFLQILQ